MSLEQVSFLGPCYSRRPLATLGCKITHVVLYLGTHGNVQCQSTAEWQGWAGFWWGINSIYHDVKIWTNSFYNKDSSRFCLVFCLFTSRSEEASGPTTTTYTELEVKWIGISIIMKPTLKSTINKTSWFRVMKFRVLNWSIKGQGITYTADLQF